MVEIEFRDYGWGGEFTARGHAGSGEYGQDAVCAGVSALLVTLARRLEGRAGCRAELRPGRARIVFLRRGKAAQDVDFTLCGLLILLPATRNIFKRWLRKKFDEWRQNPNVHITFHR